jgi:phosphatidylserine/phosphatidylglycerophosphate/cardiolipin synthase-like enzyme
VLKEKRFRVFCLALGTAFAFLFCKATSVTLPSASTPIVFYSNQARCDLKLLFCEAVRSAKSSLFASFYSLTDRDLIALLTRREKDGVAVCVQYDPSASPPLSHACLHPRRSKGLMHRKILVIDQTALYLGSANLTPTSLRHHSNFVLGLHHPPLAAFLAQNDSGSFASQVGEQEIECYLLPDAQETALRRLLSLIDQAKRTVHIAMFTFTHPQLTQALQRAAGRGVRVHAVIDHYSGNGVSKKSVEALQSAGAEVLLSSGSALLHHKWALIDKTIFAMGSANWTKAAFTKNEDFLVILSSLTTGQRKFILDLYKILEYG